ncbi:MAG: peptidoglycan-binding protein [Acetobacteraceae bacterium]|nr:peptidoglycan-binding protein [Acetobacteraceae bacterium]
MVEGSHTGRAAPRRTRALRRGRLLALAVVLLALAPGARAEPAAGRVALVVGESAYAALPPLPGCAVSAQGIAERLRQLGFDVAERANASNGVLGAALGDLARQAAAAPGASVVVYFCGYAVAFDGRAFLLPVSAVLDRPSDALTQGVPARSVIDLAARGTRVGLSVLDTYQPPRAEPGGAEALSALVAARTGSVGHFVVAGTEATVGTTATPLAQALSAALAKPSVDLDALMVELKQTQGGAFETGGGAGPAPLVPPAVAAMPPPAAPPPAPAVAPPAPAAAPPPAPVPAVAPVPPGPALPEEEGYDAQDRRRVQSALRDLGYYDGAVDGVIGPETRAAIRRYQHELGAPMTGRLTAAEATRLVAGSAGDAH